MTAYPVPTTTFTFTYLGPNGTGVPSDIKDIQLNVTCRLKVGVEYISSCTLTVHHVTSPQAAGFYTVRISNGDGAEDYNFQVMINGKYNTSEFIFFSRPLFSCLLVTYFSLSFVSVGLVASIA